MLLKIRHQTDLLYSDLISESVMELRMAPAAGERSAPAVVQPRDRAGDACVELLRLARQYVHAFTVNAFHAAIRIVATSVVETDRRKVEVERFADQWPIPTNGSTIPTTTTCTSAGRSSTRRRFDNWSKCSSRDPARRSARWRCGCCT
jgi:hypothetical protein